MADSLRYLILALDCFAMGSLLALYEKVGRFILPKIPVRLFLIATVMFLVSVAVEIYAHFGEPVRPRTVFEASALVLYLAGMLRLYLWFGTEPGRQRRHELINEFAASELHKLATLARAMEEDPNHMGRYVEPTIAGRIWRYLTDRGDQQ